VNTVPDSETHFTDSVHFYISSHMQPCKKSLIRKQFHQLSSSGIAVIGYSFLQAFRAVRAARNLHHDMLVNVLRAPMSFFDTTPVGRIVNRFSQVLRLFSTIISNKRINMFMYFSLCLLLKTNRWNRVLTRNGVYRLCNKYVFVALQLTVYCHGIRFVLSAWDNPITFVICE